jgi:hypothetical protein
MKKTNTIPMVQPLTYNEKYALELSNLADQLRYTVYFDEDDHEKVIVLPFSKFQFECQKHLPSVTYEAINNCSAMLTILFGDKKPFNIKYGEFEQSTSEQSTSARLRVLVISARKKLF